MACCYSNVITFYYKFLFSFVNKIKTFDYFLCKYEYQSLNQTYNQSNNPSEKFYVLEFLFGYFKNYLFNFFIIGHIYFFFYHSRDAYLFDGLVDKHLRQFIYCVVPLLIDDFIDMVQNHDFESEWYENREPIIGNILKLVLYQCINLFLIVVVYKLFNDFFK